MKVVSQVICVIILIGCVLSDLPDVIEKCAYGDKKCLISSSTSLFTNLWRGNAELPLPILDPYESHNLQFSENTNNLGMKLQMNNTKTFGLSKVKITKVNGFGADPNGRHELLAIAPVLSLIGDYKASGKILILNFQGEGKANLTMINPTIKITLNGVARTKDNEVYMDVQSTKLQVKCERLYIDLENLFSGNKEFGANVLQVINDNWQLLFDDLNDLLFVGINNSFYRDVNLIFEKMPYKKFFKD